MPEIIPNLHPLIVHFPIALISVSAIFHVVAITTRGKTCATHCSVLAHTTLWLGALAALPTVFFGWQAFNSVNHDDAGHVAMLLHRTWGLATLAILVILAGWDFWRSKADAMPSLWLACAVIGVWGMVAATAWHGAELVYRHGLGVLSLPATEHGQHGHEHSSVMKDAEHADVMTTEDRRQELSHEQPHEHSHDKHAH